MKAKNHNSNLDIFAKFLIILSFFIFAIGFSYQSNFYNEDTGIKDKKAKLQDAGPSIDITTADDVNVANGDTVTNNDNVVTNNDNTVTNNDNIKNNGSNEGYTNTTTNSNNTVSNSNNNENNQQQIEANSLESINDSLRKDIENTFGISVKYGSETDNYVVSNIGTVSIDNPAVVNNSLIRLKNVLGLYPNGFFSEINEGGIPLTIYLINNYNEENITGVTDSSYSYANISIAVKYPLEESFYHESYHYIERFMFKKGANFNIWNSLNPEGFTYGTVYNDNSYSNTFSADAPFVNNYAQTDDREDRASTFEYMMAPSKAICLNNGQVVWKKAMLMSRTIDAVFDTVSPDVTEYWERFLY